MKLATSIIFYLFLFNSNSCFAQTFKKGVVRITYDTIANTPARELLGPIANDDQSAFISFDSGFENDSIELYMNGKLISFGHMKSVLDLGKSGGFKIQKRKKMPLKLIVKNKQHLFEVLFDKRYCVARLHLNADGSKLEWVYTNQVLSTRY